MLRPTSRISSLIVAAASVLFSVNSQAAVSAYIPLQQSTDIERQVAMLMSVTNSPSLSKPYKVEDIRQRLPLIKRSHPRLYQGLNSFLARYKRDEVSLINAGVEVALLTDSSRALPNQRNIGSDEAVIASASAIYQPNDYLLLSAAGFYSEDQDITPTGTYLSFGIDYLQVDLGYREHWFSPFHDSALLVSTHAKASPSITISNVKPLPLFGWDIRYELFYSRLEEQERIVLGDESHPGNPRLIGTHLSFSPLDFWTIGLNRTMQFGGGKRDVSFGDVLEAFFNPAGKDNVGDEPEAKNDPNYEFGNQQASVTTQFNFELGMPVALYMEYAGEDTFDESNYRLGNVARSFGIELPFLTQDLALRYEYSDWSTHWYVHHLYSEGYTNDGQVMGHWGAGERVLTEYSPATTHMLNLYYRLNRFNAFNLTLRTVENDDHSAYDYESGYSADLRYNYYPASSDAIWGARVYFGKSTFGDELYRVGLFYEW